MQPYPRVTERPYAALLLSNKTFDKSFLVGLRGVNLFNLLGLTSKELLSK